MEHVQLRSLVVAFTICSRDQKCQRGNITLPLLSTTCFLVYLQTADLEVFNILETRGTSDLLLCTALLTAFLKAPHKECRSKHETCRSVCKGGEAGTAGEGHLGTTSPTSLLNTVFFLNGKNFVYMVERNIST